MTAGSASVGIGIRVVFTVVASLATRNNSVSASGIGAVAIATAAIGIGAVVASFKPFDLPISATCKGRVGAILGAWLRTVGVQRVTIFGGIGNAITTIARVAARL